MATLETVSHRDALDIVFANRNRAYGAYQLRRAYPNYLGKAFALGLLFIGALLVGPHILSALTTAFPDPPKQEAINCIMELRDLTPPPPPPPPLPTPPPPVQATIVYVPPVVQPDDEVQQEPPPTAIDDLEKSKAVIGDKTQEGIDDGPPSKIDPYDPGPVIEPQVTESDEEPHSGIGLQKLPTFPGGERELLKYLAENIKYPALARENNIQGTVALQFVIEKNGSVSNLVVLKDPGGGCGKEAIRVVQSMPNWSPGEANGHAVKVRFTLPVKFKLE